MRKGGAANTCLSNALRSFLAKLIPADSSRAILPSSAAPKRDHDEWLVQGRLGEGRVAASQAESIAAWASLLVKLLQTHGALDAERFRGQGRHA